MPVPTPVPINVTPLEATLASVATGQQAVWAMPFAGRITQIGATPGGTTATADATCSLTINGVAPTNNTFLVTNGTLAFVTSSGNPSGAVANQGDQVQLAFSGTGTGGASVTVYALAKRGS
jgi:hypothetical protein